jgi:prepilin-type N-terminal cleavage/methylation domain-containing protein
VTATDSRLQIVRVEDQSDRLAPADVAMKPGTRPTYRQSGFTTLEVMISMAILATVLASVISSVYTLHYSRSIAKERHLAQELARMVIERVLQGQSVLEAATFEVFYKVPGKRQPLTKNNLVSVLNGFAGIAPHLLSETNKDGINTALALNDLKVFIEYYRIDNLVYALQHGRGLDLNDNEIDDKYFDSATNSIFPKRYDNVAIGRSSGTDDRIEGGSAVIRVVVKWTTILGFEDKSEHIIARWQ